MVYRPEIDGLRAIAVVSVILYHAGYPLFSGGYIGVDVFFVISGYLITNIIAEELKNGCFSLGNFYNRRARRILPALLFISLLTFPAAWLWLPPADMYDYAQSLFSLTVFSSNFLFWLESGYFQSASELKPLIHTWSLAVEEQYYLLYPVLLMALWQMGIKRILLILGTISLLSYAYADWASINQPSAAFYLLPARAWELLLGGIVSFYLQSQKKNQIDAALADNMCFAGLALIAYTVFLLEDIRGASLTLPTIGTALIILYSNQSNITKRILSNKHLVSVGLISYSAYLWHQPLLAFAKRMPITNDEPALVGFVVLLTFPLAYLTWRFIEQPFRHKLRISTRQMVQVLSFSLVLVSSLGVYGTSNNGLDQRYAEIERLIASYYDPALDATEDQSICFFRDHIENDQLDSCLSIAGKKFAVLLGDSHAAAESHAFREALRSEGFGLISFVSNGCPPAPAMFDHIATISPDCKTFVANSYDIVKKLDADTVIVSSLWNYYLDDIHASTERDLFGTKLTRKTFNPSLDNVSNRYSDAIAVIAGEISELASQKKLIIIGPVPQNDGSWASSIRSSLMKNNYAFRLDNDYETHKELSRHFHEFARLLPSDTEIIMPENLICGVIVNNKCEILWNGKSLYQDTHHPTNTFAKLIADQLLARLSITDYK